MMQRIACVCFLLVALLLPVEVLAHSYPTVSSPSSEEIITTEMKTIQIQFNTKIEPISTIEVHNEAGDSFPVEQIKVDHDTLTATLQEPLYTDHYTITWKIVGLDGHLVEGEIPFEVQYDPPAPIIEPEEETSPETDGSTEEEHELTNTVEENQEVEAETIAASEGSLFSYLLYGLFGILGLAILYTLWKKRSSL